MQEEVKNPILIVDRQGSLGRLFAQALKNNFPVVLVASGKTQEKGIRHIVFSRRIPTIPDQSYAMILVVLDFDSDLLEFLSSFASKARETKSPLVLLSSIFFLSPQRFAKIKANAPNALLFLYGDMAGENLPSRLNALLKKGQNSGTIQLSRDGLGYLYPTIAKEFSQEVIELALTHSELGKAYFLLPEHPVTEISLARKIKQLQPEIRLDFQPDEYLKRNFFLPPEAVSLSSPNHLGEWLKQVEFPARNARVIPKKRKKKPFFRLPKSGYAFYFFLSVMALFLPLFFSLLAFTGAGIMVSRAGNSLTQGRSSEAKARVSQAQNLFHFAKTMGFEISLLSQISAFSNLSSYDRALETGIKLTAAAQDGLEGIEQLQRVTSGKSRNPRGELEKAMSNLKQALVTLQAFSVQGTLPGRLQQSLKIYGPTLTLMTAEIDSLPSLLGFPQKKTYLVLLQNNNELRPGGGFIGSYGILTVDRGLIGPLKVHDVYDADGQLIGRVEPPFALRRYLGASNWYLRDSNYASDFVTNAEKAAFFLDKETGQRVDAVIGVDTTTLVRTLSIVGSVKVISYGEELNKDNVVKLTQDKAQTNFFPGSTQKKDFLRASLGALEEQIKTSPQKQPELLALIGQLFLEKHLLLVSFDPDLQKIIAANQLSSTLPREQVLENTAQDFLGLSEINVGQNKVNAYLTRQIDHTVKLDEAGGVLASTTVNYQNTSQPNDAFVGDYNAYVRFLVPREAQLLSVQIDNVEMATTPAIIDPAEFTRSGFIPPKELEVEATMEGDKRLWGMFVKVKPQASRKLTLTYSLPGTGIQTGQGGGYNLQLFKQPGTLEDPLSFTLSLPPAFSVVSTQPKMEASGGEYKYKTRFRHDQSLMLRLVKVK